ncbi:MAG: 2-oxo-4-hydroxy-4-carboxy-5-ureidoimidazoline decarboxylase [Pseudomonadota bacterium]
MDLLNTTSETECTTLLSQCCASHRWVAAMLAMRPYHSPASVLDAAEDCWHKLEETDWLEAFDAHPKIGDPDSLKQKYRDTHSMAKGEQSGVDAASESVIEALADANQQYEGRFGFIFIVCATGKSAAEMLHLLNQRLNNARDQELQIAAAEQLKITLIRLEKLTNPS